MINQLAFKGFPLGAKEVGKTKLSEELGGSKGVEENKTFESTLKSREEGLKPQESKSAPDEITSPGSKADKLETKSELVKKPERFFEKKVTDQDGNTEIEDTEEIDESVEQAPKVVSQIQPDQVAILQFMDSLESEHGISPTRFVEVMSDLKPAELKAPASQTASKVVSQLGLPPESEAAVLEQYQELLGQMKAPESALPKMKELRLQQSLDRMSNAFFVNQRLDQTAAANQVGPFAKVDALNGGDNAILLQKYAELQPTSADAYKQAFDGLKLMTQMKENGMPIPSKEIATEANDDEGESVAAFLGLSAGSEVLNEATVMGDHSGQTGEGLKDFIGKHSESAKGPKVKIGGEEQMFSQMIAGQISGDLKNSPGPIDSANLVVAPKISPDVQSQNMQSIINQTQNLVAKGGGESTIILKPEGLGAIELKVEVREGKVNVQMLTESKETKKLFENSTQDLAQKLNDNNLIVDKIKVDTHTSSSFDLNQQQGQQQQFDDQMQRRLADLRDNLHRESARQFMGQFRDENFNNRSGFMDQGKSNSNRGNRPKPLAPIGATAATAAAPAGTRYLGSKKGSGLDLVA